MDDPQIARERERTLEWALAQFRRYWDKGISPYNVTLPMLLAQVAEDLGDPNG